MLKRILLNPNNPGVSSTQPIQMSNLRQQDNVTFSCHICKQKRKASHLKVRHADVSHLLGTPDGMLVLNVRYCCDNDCCAEVAQNSEEILRKYVKGFTSDEGTPATSN